ncbi:MAG: AraC family transcriptional regulator [Ferruginibacter sp.]
MKVYLKNMVCNRCVMVVKSEFEKLGLKTVSVSLGEVDLQAKPSQKEMQEITERMNELGFEFLDDQKHQLIEKIKISLIKEIQNGIKEHFIISDFLATLLNKDYSSISRLFSEVEGMTLEQYFILQKIERVKELLIYGEKNTSEISYELGYSSVAHLSGQFKKVTGLTPSEFKKIGRNRKSLDKIN